MVLCVLKDTEKAFNENNDMFGSYLRSLSGGYL